MSKTNKTPRYSDTAVLGMCNAPWQWTTQLRVAAAQRKLDVTSVTPIVTVVAALRATL